MAEKERKCAVDQVRELLHRPRSSADFSPAARCAVQRLVDYAEQEHELRSKAEDRCVRFQSGVAGLTQTTMKQEQTIKDLRQQLSFLRQAVQEVE